MSLTFPNPSRAFQEARKAVGFTGYDGMFEIQFFIEVDALASLGAVPQVPTTPETRWLAAFDAKRASILDVAREAHASSRRTHYTLTASDFR